MYLDVGIAKKNVLHFMQISEVCILLKFTDIIPLI